MGYLVLSTDEKNQLKFCKGYQLSFHFVCTSWPLQFACELQHTHIHLLITNFMQSLVGKKQNWRNIKHEVFLNFRLLLCCWCTCSEMQNQKKKPERKRKVSTILFSGFLKLQTTNHLLLLLLVFVQFLYAFCGCVFVANTWHLRLGKGLHRLVVAGFQKLKNVLSSNLKVFLCDFFLSHYS